jgi:hypothetical protein
MQEYVSIPVPVDRVQEVYELLGRPKGSAGSVSEPEEPAGRKEYKAPDTGLVQRAYRESADAMRKVFIHLAANPDRVVPMDELAKAVGYTGPSEMAGAMGAFGRRWKNRYHGGKDAWWPFDSWWDYERNMMVYRMPAAVADAIKSI